MVKRFLIGLMILSSPLRAETLEKLMVFGALGNGDRAFGYVSGVPGSGLAFRDREIFLIDRQNHKIKTYGPDGAFIGSFGEFGCADGQINDPVRLAADDGFIYVLDFYRIEYDKNRTDLLAKPLYYPRVQKFDRNGVLVYSVGGSGVGEGEFYGTPADITVDGLGRLLVLDSGNKRVQVFAPDGRYQFQFGAFGSGSGCFNNPVKIDTDANNNIYVLDAGNHSLLKFGSDGRFVKNLSRKGLEDDKIGFQTYFRVLKNASIAVLDSFSYSRGNDLSSFLLVVRIKYFDLDGRFLRFTDCVYKEKTGTPADYPFNWRNFLGLDEEGRIFVGSSEDNRIAKYRILRPDLNTAGWRKNYYVNLARAGSEYQSGNFNVTNDRPLNGTVNRSPMIELRNGFRLGVNIDRRRSLSIDESVTFGLGRYTSRNLADSTILEDREPVSFQNNISANYSYTYDLERSRYFGASFYWYTRRTVDDYSWPNGAQTYTMDQDSIDGSLYLDLSDRIRWILGGYVGWYDNREFWNSTYNQSRSQNDRIYTELTIDF